MKFYKLSGIGYPVKIHKFYILLFALCFYNIAYGQNQPITVSMKNQPLLKVFEIIEDQTDFSIAYNQTKLDVKQKVSQFCQGSSLFRSELRTQRNRIHLQARR